ncbi:MAG: hypothetical protein ABI315_09915 [Bacteroidia bacterium]
MKITLVLFSALYVLSTQAQILTKEDSLNAGLIKSPNTTVISGYGSVKYKYQTREKIAHANLDRVVLFLGHKFSNKISFFSELEVEDAKVTGGEVGGEVALEQAFLKFDINKNIYVVAGLFIPRIGIINENHLPNTFNGNDRPFLESLIIPSTWREIGVGLYGNLNSIPGLNYSVGLVNGLNSAGFENGTGIRGGRFEGRNANASAIAVTGSLLYYIQNFRIQASGYYGGSAGLTKREADSLLLSYGSFGTPVALAEADMQYNHKGFSVKALYTIVNISDAQKINRAYANNTPQVMTGYYCELGYDILKFFKTTDKNLTVFARYENLNMNHKLPKNGIYNGTLNQQFVVGGITFKPIKGVTIKADYIFKETGERNPALVVTPFPQSLPYFKKQGFFSLGLGYSF